MKIPMEGPFRYAGTQLYNELAMSAMLSLVECTVMLLGVNGASNTQYQFVSIEVVVVTNTIKLHT